MLSNIAQNSSQLIRSQFNDDQQLLNQLIKLKNKRKNPIYYENNSKKGSIFEEPQFCQKIDFFNHKKRISYTSKNTTYRIRSSSEETKQYKTYQFTSKNTKHKNSQNLSLSIGKNINNENNSKAIHTRKNNKWKLNNRQKIHHQRVYQSYKKNFKFLSTNQLIQEPGFVNLCFYKNTLQQIQNLRTARTAKTSNQKRLSLQKQAKQKLTKNKIKFTKYKSVLTDQNPQYRPWSPQRDTERQSYFPNFKSLHLTLQC